VTSDEQTRVTVTVSLVSGLSGEHGLLGYNERSTGAPTPLASPESRLCKFVLLTDYTCGLYLIVEQSKRMISGRTGERQGGESTSLRGQHDLPGVRGQETRGSERKGGPNESRNVSGNKGHANM